MLAIKMKNGNPEDTLFKVVLSESDQGLLKKVKTFANPKFTVGFHSIIASYYPTVEPGMKKKEVGINLPVSATSVLKGTVTSEQILLCRHALVGMFVQILKDFDAFPSNHPSPVGLDFGAEEAKTIVQMLADPSISADTFKGMLPASLQTLAQTIPPLSTATMAGPGYPQNVPKPTNDVIKLSQAKALGQRVKGTSAGSVYIVAAVSANVRLAMRYEGTKLSVRAEGTPTLQEIAYMKAFGMTEGSTKDTGSYWSMHMEVGSVPVQRVVGAVLMGLGIAFDHVITNPKEVLC